MIMHAFIRLRFLLRGLFEVGADAGAVKGIKRQRLRRRLLFLLFSCGGYYLKDK